MEFEKFANVREGFCLKYPEVTEGTMMGSPAIHYKNKVFAFYSRNDKMVFRLGKDYPKNNSGEVLSEFNPFRNKGPLTGWFESGFEQRENWESLAEMALTQIQMENK